MENQKVGFRSYEDFVTDLKNGRILGNRFDMLDNYVIVGIEMKNGEVLVYDNGTVNLVNLKNRQEFNEKYEILY